MHVSGNWDYTCRCRDGCCGKGEVRALPPALTVVVGTVVVSNVVVLVVEVDVYFGTMAKVRPVFEENRVASHPENSWHLPPLIPSFLF